MNNNSVNLRMWNELYDRLDEDLHRQHSFSTGITCDIFIRGQLKYPLEFRIQNMFNDPVLRQLRDDYITHRRR